MQPCAGPGFPAGATTGAVLAGRVQHPANSACTDDTTTGCFKIHLPGSTAGGQVLSQETTLTVQSGAFNLETGTTMMGNGAKQFSDQTYTMGAVAQELHALWFHRGPRSSGVVSMTVTSKVTTSQMIYIIASNGNGDMNWLDTLLTPNGFSVRSPQQPCILITLNS